MSAAVAIAAPRRFQFDVRGIPQPQGSKDAHHRNGRTWVSEANKNLRPWRVSVIDAAARMLDGQQFERFEGPVRLTVTFTFPRPRSHFGTGRNLGQVKGSAPRWVTSSQCGDLDKLVRAIGDSLTEAAVWRDDSQVVSVLAMKGYGERPGAFIEIEAVE